MTTATATPPRELIPGYRPIERLGAGGYGEVWRTEAPGGLFKAVKLVYGFLGDERAERELKALERIKEVRHPFVLSLERIEIIDGRLMIVTELADMSLMDRFEQCRAANLPGIPRGELLQYLQDTADALDYMQQHHSLQHLDIKPENLLVVGGRAKVADFGLVKELTDQTRSMVGAMTPTYAAPELFDGRASEFCDQYSLAIVYQELLTGALPFPGRTAHQLAAQHTQSAPQLAALPGVDRDIVARALAKNPQDRYPSCIDLARALAGAATTPAAAQPPVHERTSPPAGERQHTCVLDMDDTHPSGRAKSSTPVAGKAPGAVQATELMSRERLSSRSLHVAPKPTMQRPVVKASTKVVDVSPPMVDSEPAIARPTLVIGVGGTGIEILGQLNRFLLERRDAAGNPPPLSMLAFDTDRATTMQAANKGMEPDDVVLLRLRQASEYRADSDALLKWIGRRWLYNIPKSMETGGFRPLGRLALVDQAGVVVSKLRRRLAKLLENNNDDEESTDAAAAPAPRVVLVGACSGGTGGGMLLEMAYAVQNIAQQLNRDDIEQIALVTHGTNRCRTSKQLAQANAYSFLAELQHYAQYGSWSPDGAAPQAAVFEGEGWPVKHGYFYHLGDDLDGEQYRDQARRAAEYLHATLATPLAGVIESCRDEPPDNLPPDFDLRLRSFRIQSYQGVGREVREGLQQAALAEVVNRWFAKTHVPGSQAETTAGQPQHSDAPAWKAAQDKVRQCLNSLGSTRAAKTLSEWTKQQLPADADETTRQRRWDELARQTEIVSNQLLALRDEVQQFDPPLGSFATPLSTTVDDLQALIAKAAAQLASDVLHQTLDSMTQANFRGSGAPPASLVGVLIPATAEAATAMLRQCLPGAKLSANGEVRPDVEAMIADASAPPQFKVGSRRRTLVLRPAASNIDAALAGGLPRECGFVDGHASAAVVCEELADVSLAQIADAIIAGDSETRSVAVRIHSRADIQWTEPALVEAAT